MRIKKSIVLPVLSLIIICFPGHVVTFYSMSAIFRILQMAAVVFTFFCEIKLWKRYREDLGLLNIWLLWSVINALICGSSFNDMFYFALAPYAGAVIAYQIYIINGENFVHTLSKFFSLFLVINMLSYLSGGLYQDSIYRNIVYFIGIRVNINYIFLFACVICMISFYKGRLSEKIIAIVGIGSGLFFSIGEWVSTSIGASLVMLVVFFCMHLSSRWPAQRNIIRLVALILVTGIISFTISPKVENFSWFIEDILGENLTLDGRTEIWESALSQIKGSRWIFGHGVSHDYQFALSNGAFVSHPHNQYLSLLFIYGLIGLAIFIFMLLKTIKVCTEDIDPTCKAILVAGFFSIAVMGISMTYYSQPYWLIWYLACRCIVREDNESYVYSDKFIEQKDVKLK